MTISLVDDHQLVDVAPESLRRTLDIARRALHADGAVAIAPNAFDIPAGVEHDSTFETLVALETGPVARLVVKGRPGRLWSEDEQAILRDLAAGLAEEIRLTKLVMRLESRLSDAAAAVSLDIVDVPADAALAGLVATSNEHDNDADVVAASLPGAIRILLADDLDLNRKLICDMLSLDGYVVDSVADGAAAVDAVKAKTYDLVLMDMIMPGMDGLDATRAIRALPTPICDVPIVALTAHSFREQLDNCLHAGMNATLTKPMSFDALSTAVSTWARNRQAA